jgi:hypothetical protein
MIKPPVKATDALEKPPAAKPLRSRWLPDYDPTPRVNVSYTNVPTHFTKKVSYQTHHQDMARTCAMFQSYPYIPFV